jgi:hypothetical protein
VCAAGEEGGGVGEWVGGVQTKTGRGGPCMGRQVAVRYERRVVRADIKNPPVDMTGQVIGMCIHLHPRTNLTSAPCNTLSNESYSAAALVEPQKKKIPLAKLLLTNHHKLPLIGQ